MTGKTLVALPSAEEIDHSTCAYGVHDHDFDPTEDPPEQAHDGNIRLCNHGDGAVLFYCRRDEGWHHGGFRTNPCFLVGDAPRETCVYSRLPGSRAVLPEPARVCLTHDPYGMRVLKPDQPCPRRLDFAPRELPAAIGERGPGYAPATRPGSSSRARTVTARLAAPEQLRGPQP